MTAILSCEKPVPLYRYRLERQIDLLPTGRFPTLAWLMVNPSTADAAADDPTIRKVRGFSHAAGAVRIIVGNLFAFRATDVRELRSAADPIGPENDTHLRSIIRDADAVVVAWGASAKFPKALRGRWQAVVALAAEAGKLPLLCIGTAQDGHPLHPLMPSYDRALVPWSPPHSIREVAR